MFLYNERGTVRGLEAIYDIDILYYTDRIL